MGARPVLFAIAVLGAVPVAAQAAPAVPPASIRVLDALGGRPITVTVAGQRKPLLTDAFGRVTQRYALQAGLRTLTVRRHGSVVTALRVRVFGGEHLTLVLAQTPTGPRLRAVREPWPVRRYAVFMVVDATSAGPVSVTLGSNDLPTPLTLASGMRPGQWTRPVRVPAGSSVAGWYVSATVAGRSAGRVGLIPAALSVTIVVVAQTRHGPTVLRLPWDVPLAYARVSVADITHPGAYDTGDSLVCITPTLFPAGSQRSFAWFDGQSPLSVGANGPTYTIQGATGGSVGTPLSGASITCTVRVTPPNGTAVVFSASTPPVHDVAAAAAVTEADDPSNPSNITLTCTVTHGWSNPEATTFQWQKDGSLVGTGNTLAVPPSAVSFTAGHAPRYAYTCTVTATASGWTDSTAQSTANLPMLPPMPPSVTPDPPSITTSLTTPESGSSPPWPDASATLTEEWFNGCTSSGDASQGCTDTGTGGPAGTTTYTLQATDLGKYLGYRVKASDGGFYTYDFVFSQAVGP